MANKKISALAATALARKTDSLEKVDGVSGISEKVTVSQLMTAFGISIPSNAPAIPFTISASGAFTLGGVAVADGDPTVPSLNLINGQFAFNSIGLQMAGGTLALNGALLAISSGANQRAGNLTLIGGTKTIANTSITANTIVILTRKVTGGTIGFAVTYTLNPGVGFTVNSDNALDTSTYSYMLVEVP